MRYSDNNGFDEADRRLKEELEKTIARNIEIYNSAVRKMRALEDGMVETSKEEIYADIYSALSALDEAYDKIDLYSLYNDREELMKRWKKVKRLLEIYKTTVRGDIKDNEEPEEPEM